MTTPRIAILGAGPIGLDAALAAAEAGWDVDLYEAGDRPAAHVRDWGHVRLFSPWSIDASPRMRRALAEVGRSVPDDDACPTGHELCDLLLDPVAGLPAVAKALRLGTRVVAVGREGLLKHEAIGTGERDGRRFRLLVEGPVAGDETGLSGKGERIEYADAVLDCTGTYTHPNRLGDGGIPAPGELALDDEGTRGDRRIVRRVPDVASEAAAWAGKTILLVGAGHSAQTAARDLARLAEEHPGTRVIWALRSTEAPSWRIDDDPLPARAALAGEAEALARGESSAVEPRLGVVVDALAERDGKIAVTLGPAGGPRDSRSDRGDRGSETVGPDRVDWVDRVLALTGAVGDDRLYRQLQVHECYATGAPMKLSAALLGEAAAAGGGGGSDCMAQTGFGPETLTNPEPRFFILGAKSYGRNSAFLMRIGWEQVSDAVALLADAFGRPARASGTA